jgi:hypothetical protein
MNIQDIIAQMEAEGVTTYGGGMFEDVRSLGEVKVNKTDTLLETSTYGKLQLVLKGEKTAYVTVKSERQGDNYVQPKRAKYNLMLRRVKNYGAKTIEWLENAGIDPANLKPGTVFVHAIAQ